MSGAVLRRATLADADALATVGRNAFIAAFGHLYRRADLDAFLSEHRTPAAYLRHLAEPPTQVQVAEIDGRIAGYCLIVRGELFEPSPDPLPKRPVLLSQLYTDPSMTGRGLGGTLIEWAIAEARAWRADAVQLSVYSENYGAQRLYQRYGFKHVADVAFWVGNHRDPEFLYQLAL